MWKIIVYETNFCIEQLKKLDKKVITIFITVAFLQTLSYYFSSPKYFRLSIYNNYFIDNNYGEFYEYVYWFVSDFIIYSIFPLLIIVYFFKEKISSYGLMFGKINKGLLFTLFSVIVFVPIIYFVSSSENFSEYFPLYQDAKSDLQIFILYEVLLILFLFAWEFLFRGFMLFGLESKFGFYAIFIQMIPFVILHNGKPIIETISSIFGALILGYLALRTRSILYGFLIHAFILVSLDIIAFTKY